MKRPLVLFLLGWATLFLASLAVHAGLSPENVAVIVNADSWASMTVANEFIALRDIPASHVIYISEFENLELMSVETFRTKILKQVFELLGRRGLGYQIDCIVYSSDIPYIIDISSDIPPATRSPAIGSHASITGLTFLYQLVLPAKGHYAALNTNFYHRRLILPVQETPLGAEEITSLQRIQRLMSEGKLPEAREALEGLAEKHPRNARIQYELAVCLARLNCHDEALQALNRSVDGGLLNWRDLARQEAFKPLRERNEFQKLLQQMKERRYEVAPSAPFRATRAWDPQGNSVAPGRGLLYMLSTMLGVTGGRGNSVKEVLEGLRRSASADAQQPQGTFYFMRNEDIRSIVRDWLFESVAERLMRDGFRAEILEGRIPLKKNDVLGAVVGTATFDWSASGSTILPGAICEHFTSFGGRLTEEAGQTPISAWVREGASGTSGTVAEPLAIHTKFPNPFLHVHYARGCSLAEAFYLSVAAPYQLLILGDPLCAPWARPPQLELDGLAEGQTLSGKHSFSVRMVGPPENPLSLIETYIDGVRTSLTQPTQPVQIETTNIPDGWHRVTVIGVRADGIETRTRKSVSVRIANSGHLLRATTATQGPIPMDIPLKIAASLPGAARIEITHNSRVLATIEGESGSAEIDLHTIGCGTVNLFCVGILADEHNTRVFGPPLSITVIPPDPMPALKSETAQMLPGFILLRPQRDTVVVTDTRSNTWLKDAGVAPEDEFTLQGIYEATEDEICQFQLRTDGKAEIFLDGKKLCTLKTDKWRCVAASLEKGQHRLEVRGIAGPSALLSIRLGSRGTRRIGSAVLRYPAEAQTPVPHQ